MLREHGLFTAVWKQNVTSHICTCK